MTPIILNESSNDHPHQFPTQFIPLSNPSINSSHFLPLNQQDSSQIATKIKPSHPQPTIGRHPTFLLHKFPDRPHYYQPNDVGAQEGYCLSPIPPELEQLKNMNIIDRAQPSPEHSTTKLSACPASTFLVSRSSSLSSSSAIAPSSASASSSSSTSLTLSSFFNSSNSKTNQTHITSSSSSSSSSFSSTESKHIEKSEKIQSSTSTATTMSSGQSDQLMMTKKVLPIPPSLSNRVRQIFIQKIGTQQAQSCAQLPRRKKKNPVQS